MAISVEETAKILGLSRNLTYELVKTGKIFSVRLGKRIIIPLTSLERLTFPPKTVAL